MWVAGCLLLYPTGTIFPAELIEKPQQSVDSTTDKSELARQRKERGDQYVAQDDFAKAADEYIQALDLQREAFSPGERVQMAIYLSWADQLARSEEELRAVLAADPKNIEARIHLARVLSWSGELTAAIEEANKVLEQSPENREALLVKADALQWKGLLGEAMPIYKNLSAKNDDFDSRIGLSSAYLAAGNRMAAEESLRSLTPANAQQQRQLTKLSDDIQALTSPRLDLRYSYYRDSDENRVNRYSVAAPFWVQNFDLGINFRHTQASGNDCVLHPNVIVDRCRVGNKVGNQDKIKDARAEDLGFKVYTHLNESFGLGGGIGFGQVANGSPSTYPTGFLKADAKILNASIGAGVTREVLSDTAQLIENRIRLTTAGFYLSQFLTDRWSVNAAYNYKSFSDNNYANEARFGAQYFVYLNPKIAVGYRFRFLDFKRQTGSGYFDPQDYVANRIFSSLYLEKEKFYVYSEVFAGYETFRRYGSSTNQPVGGGSASLGYKPTRNLSLEFSIEGGSFAAATTAGFNYFMLGPRLLFRF